MTEDRVNCSKCLSKYDGRKDKEEMTLKLRKTKGCFEASKSTLFPTEFIKYKKCIGNFRDNSFSYLYNYTQVYKKGINPFGGNYSDTPNKFVEIANLVDNLFVNRQIEEMQKQSKK